MSTHITIKKGFGYFRYYVMDGIRTVVTSGEYATLEQCISSAIADFGELPIPDKTGKFMYEGLDYFEWNAVKMPPGVAGNKVTDDIFAIQELIDRSPEGETIFLPTGDYYISEPMRLIDKKVDLCGRGMVTIWCDKEAMIIDGNGGGVPFISNITFQSRGGIKYHGIDLRKTTDFKNVNVINFDGYGIFAEADVTRPTPSNVSFCNFEHTNVNGQGHGAGGIFFRGGDASQCWLKHCDVRDTVGVGIHDHGFLGVHAWHCQGHANKMGQYRADDPNNRSTWISCYNEGDSIPSYFGGHAQIYGGIASAGGMYVLADYAIAYGMDGAISRRFPSHYDMSQDILKIKQLLKL